MAITDFLAKGGMPNPFGNATGAIEETGDFMAESKKEAEAPPINFEIESKDGQEMAHLHMGMDDLKKIMGKLQNQEAILTHYTDEMARREQQTRAHPIANLLSNVAGAMAQDPKMPGWVHALGKTSQQLNPTPDALADRRMAVQGGIADILKQEAGVTQAMGAIPTRMMAQEREDRLVKSTADSEQRAYYSDALKGAMATGEFEAEPFIKMQVAAGANPAVAQSRADELTGIANKKARLLMDAAAAKTEAEKQKNADDLKKIEAQGKNMLAAVNARNEKADVTRAAKEEKTEKGEELKAYTTKVKDKLEAAGELEDQVKQLRIKLQERDALIGQFAGRAMPTWVAKKRADLEYQTFTQMNSIRGMIQAGARFWNPQEYTNLSPKLIQINKPTDVNLAIADETEKFIQNNRKWTVMTNPDVNWDHPKRQAALGSDGPSIVKEWHGAMTDVTQGTVPPSQATIPREAKDFAAKGPQDGKPRSFVGDGKRYTVVNGVIVGVEDAR